MGYRVWVGAGSYLRGDVLPCGASGALAKLRGRGKHWPIHRGVGMDIDVIFGCGRIASCFSEAFVVSKEV